ncbi:hypothetical protein N9X05_19750 [Paracoccaceae bacterium]|nr:hypothetical protein [Paracoccaceae bacterium]
MKLVSVLSAIFLMCQEHHVWSQDDMEYPLFIKTLSKNIMDSFPYVDEDGVSTLHILDDNQIIFRSYSTPWVAKILLTQDTDRVTSVSVRAGNFLGSEPFEEFPILSDNFFATCQNLAINSAECSHIISIKNKDAVVRIKELSAQNEVTSIKITTGSGFWYGLTISKVSEQKFMNLEISNSPKIAFVTANKLNVRSISDGNVVDIKKKNEGVFVFGIDGEWVKIGENHKVSKIYLTKRYNLADLSQADIGTEENIRFLQHYGVINQKIERKDSLENDEIRISELMAILEPSDDISKYSDQMINAVIKIITTQKCKLNEIRDFGGWVKSEKKKDNYFVDCGGKRIWLNPKLGSEIYTVNPINEANAQKICWKAIKDNTFKKPKFHIFDSSYWTSLNGSATYVQGFSITSDLGFTKNFFGTCMIESDGRYEISIQD